MIATAHKKDMLTTPYVFNDAARRRRWRRWSRYHRLPPRLDRGGAHWRSNWARKLNECPGLIDAWAGAALKVRPDTVLAHGGPIAEPADADYIMKIGHDPLTDLYGAFPRCERSSERKPH